MPYGLFFMCLNSLQGSEKGLGKTPERHNVIDWITAVLPCKDADALVGGMLVCIDESGEIAWQANRKIPVEGSFSSKIHVKVDTANSIWVSGNPAKFLQGHNLFGTNDLRQLMFLAMGELVDRLDLRPSEEDLNDWREGRYDLKCVDVAECYRLANDREVDNWIRSASPLIRGKHQGVSAYGGETIYVGQKSRRIALKIYNKSAEFRKHKPANSIPRRAELVNYSEGLLRVEVRILSQELKRRGLSRASEWSREICAEIHRERIGRLEMPEKLRLTKTEFMELPPRLIGVVKAWEAGTDLRAHYPKSSFYRYRRDLRKYGIDISSPPKTETNVVPLVSYLTAEHQAEVPEWAVGTSLIACAS